MERLMGSKSDTGVRDRLLYVTVEIFIHSPVHFGKKKITSRLNLGGDGNDYLVVIHIWKIQNGE